VLVAEIQSGCHPWVVFVNIRHGPILLSILGLRARRTFADLQGTAHLGGRPSHLIFLELREAEVQLRRIHFYALG
jgi:hypothetical protein